MAKKSITGLEAVSERTKQLWYCVCRKYGDHAYRLGVNGLGEVILFKGYTEAIAKGNRQAQQTLKKLLAE